MNTNPKITEADVVAFLKDNPCFFTEKKHLFLSLNWPILNDQSKDQKAASLGTMQLQELRKSLDSVLAELEIERKTAQYNEVIYRQFNMLYQQIIKAKTFEQLHKSVSDNTKQIFDLPYSLLLLKENYTNIKLLEQITENNSKIFCGRLSIEQEQELNAEFNLENIQQKSIAIVPVNYKGYWLLVSDNEDHFHSDKNNLLLELTSNLLNTAIEQVG